MDMNAPIPVHTCIHIQVHMCTHEYAYVHMYMYAYVCAHICMHVYTCVHTYIHFLYSFGCHRPALCLQGWILLEAVLKNLLPGLSHFQWLLQSMPFDPSWLVPSSNLPWLACLSPSLRDSCVHSGPTGMLQDTLCGKILNSSRIFIYSFYITFI